MTLRRDRIKGEGYICVCLLPEKYMVSRGIGQNPKSAREEPLGKACFCIHRSHNIQLLVVRIGHENVFFVSLRCQFNTVRT